MKVCKEPSKNDYVLWISRIKSTWERWKRKREDSNIGNLGSSNSTSSSYFDASWVMSRRVRYRKKCLRLRTNFSFLIPTWNWHHWQVLRTHQASQPPAHWERSCLISKWEMPATKVCLKTCLSPQLAKIVLELQIYVLYSFKRITGIILFL